MEKIESEIAGEDEGVTIHPRYRILDQHALAVEGEEKKRIYCAYPEKRGLVVHIESITRYVLLAQIHPFSLPFILLQSHYESMSPSPFPFLSHPTFLSPSPSLCIPALRADAEGDGGSTWRMFPERRSKKRRVSREPAVQLLSKLIRYYLE